MAYHLNLQALKVGAPVVMFIKELEAGIGERQ